MSNLHVSQNQSWQYITCFISIVQDVLETLGPSDGTVVCTPLTGANTVKISEDIIGTITSKVL